MAATLAVALASTVVPEMAAAARPERWKPPTPDEVTPVAGVAPVTWRSQPTWSADAARVRGETDIVWPDAGEATVALSSTARAATQAGDLPVSVAPVVETGAAAAPLGKVGVETFARAAAADAGVFGVLVGVARDDGVQAAAKASVTVDYGGFATAGGGDWASRLRLVQLPACALTTPKAAGCATVTPVASRNDLAAQTVTAVAPLAATGDATVLALSAAPDGDNGDYKATSLTAASTWDVSTQTGAFTWSLPLRTVPAVGGPSPSLSLSYSSQTMDGRTGGNNTQGSWAGDGFDLWPGYIERTYKPCSEDTGAINNKEPNNKNNPTGDDCWWKANATLSLNGHGTELIDAGGGQWRGVSDDGSKVERLVGGVSNGDDDGESWKVSTKDGTQYFFGRSATSAWVTQVYGNHPDDPGYTAGNFAGSRRAQAWRWNLDRVIDPHGNTMTLHYGKEEGAYGREYDPTKRTTYDRGGYLTRIDYGTRDGSSAPASARVVFDSEDRCKPGATCFGSNGRAIEASFPDTPFDQYCYATPCTDKLSPTYWTQKRLAKVRTQIHTGGGEYADVESWTLRHEWLDAGVTRGEGIPMFLRGVTHRGHVGDDEADPEIVFDPGAEPLPNRVDGPSDNRTRLNRWRIKRVTTESGAQILVDYKPAQCTRDALPAAHANDKLCFPQMYAPEGETPTPDWFHKYVVAKLTANDNAAGSDPQVTHFDYLDTPAWHHDDSDLVKEEKRTWGQFRGFGRVQVRTGVDGAPQLAQEERFLRGMDADKQPGGTTRDVWVTDSWGNRIEDHKAYAGRSLETITLDGPNGPWVKGQLTLPTTPIRTAASGTLEGWMVNTATTRAYSRTTVEADGVRWARTDTRYNADNLPTEVDDLGDETTAADDRCTRTWYARNPDIGMLDRVKRSETVGVACGVTPKLPDDMVASTRTTYDKVDGNWDTHLPTRGLPAKVEELDRWTGTTPHWITTATTTYDDNGRVASATDALGHTTTTSYTPAAAGPLTKTVVTNPAGHTTTTTFAPEWNLPRTIVDANDVPTELRYDGLGRIARVWLAGRPTGDPANLEFDYLVRNDAPTAVTSRTLLPTGSGHTTRIVLYDGWLRERQTQTQAPGGGRALTETHYNSRAEKWWTAAPYHDESGAGPDTTLVAASRSAIPSVVEYGYDNAGRPSFESLQGTAGEIRRTTTSYLGDLTVLTPPEGGTRTATLLDARGQTVQTRQYHARTGDPAAGYDRTAYTYTDAGKLATVTDAAGNVWKSGYDQRGREIRHEDPDKGITLAGYDAMGRQTSATDARNIAVATTYDALGRKETVRDATADGNIRARWFYDTLDYGKGRLTRSVRYDGGGSYTNEITGYDKAGNPSGRTVTIPSNEGAVCAAGGATPCSYATTLTYKADGQVSTTTLPKLGGLAAEQLTQNYNDVGAPSTIASSSGALLRSVHYDKTGRLTQRVLGGLGKQVASGLAFDDATGQLAAAEVALENKPTPMQLAYGYDAAGNLQRIHDTPAGQPTDTQCYRYDHLRRLRDAWTPGNGDCGPAPTTAALAGPASYWHSYEYTGAAGLTGSRTKEIWHATAGNTTRTYSHPAQGGPAGSRPHALSRVDTDNPTAPDTVDTYTYDSAGNIDARVIAGTSSNLDYDAEGRLQATTTAGKNTQYLYDADGALLIRRDPGTTGTTLYLPDGQEVNVAPGATTAKGTRYLSHAGDTIGVRSQASGLTFLVGDHHDTGEVAVKASDLAVARRRTLPFGAPRGAAPAGWPGDKAFVGGTSQNQGLVLVGARLYEPGAGRFVSVDPEIDHLDPQTLHGYAYANNAPPVFADPTGRMYPLDDIGGGGGGGGRPPTACTGTPDRCADQRGLNTPSPTRVTKATGTGGSRPAPKVGAIPIPGPRPFFPPCGRLCDRLRQEWEGAKQAYNEFMDKEWSADWGTYAAGGTNTAIGVKGIYGGVGKMITAVTGEVASGTILPLEVVGAWGVWQTMSGIKKVDKGLNQIDEAARKPACTSECTTRDNLKRWLNGVVPTKLSWDNAKDWLETIVSLS